MGVRTYLGQGQKFPTEIDSFGRIALESDAALIKQSLKRLFATPVGTEFFREHYGSHVRECQFEPNDVVLKSLLDYFLSEAIFKWERRINLYDIQYVQNKAFMNAQLFYQIKKSSEVDSFIYPFYRELKN